MPEENMEMSFAQGVNMSINILGKLVRKLEDELAGNPNIGEIAKMLEEIGGGWGRIQELLGEGKEEVVPPGQPSAQGGE